VGVARDGHLPRVPEEAKGLLRLAARCILWPVSYTPHSYAGYGIRLKPSPSTTFVNRFCGTCQVITRWTDDACHACGKGPPPTPSAA